MFAGYGIRMKSLKSHLLQFKHGEQYKFLSGLRLQTTFTKICFALNVLNMWMSSYQLITWCWIATYLVEIYCNVGNTQRFPLMHRSWGLPLGGDFFAGGCFYTGIHLHVLFSVIVRMHLIRWKILLCMLSIHDYAFKSAQKYIFCSSYSWVGIE